MRARTLAAVVAALVFPAGAAAQPEHWGAYVGGTQYLTATPTAYPGLPEAPVQVDASNASSYALEANGTVWALGSGNEGELGNGATANSPTEWVQVHLPEGLDAVSIGEAKDEGLAVTSTGRVYGWGEDGEHSLCLSSTAKQLTPVELPGLSEVVEAQGGQNHVLYRLADGQVEGCGTNAEGALGLGETVTGVKVPTVIPGVSGAAQVSAGCKTSLVRTTEGQVLGFGSDDEGQVGVGSTSPVWAPHVVELPGPATDISSGGWAPENGSSFAVIEGSYDEAWGDDQSGQLGDGHSGTGADETRPVDTGLTFPQVVTGGSFTLGLTAEGKVDGWGSNDRDELTAAHKANVLTPVELVSGASMISATAFNALTG